MGFFAPPPIGSPSPTGSGGLPPVIISPPSQVGLASVSQVGAALSSVLGFAQQAVTWLKSWATALFGSLYGGLQRVMAALLGFLRWLKEHLTARVILGLWERIKKIYATVRKYADQIQKIIHQIRKIQDYYYNLIFKPIFDFIQRLRRVLLVFRIFHLRFAQRLDNYLAGLEARIAKNFLRVRQDLNRLSDYINLIVDPLGLFHTGIYLRSAARSIGELIGLIYKKQYKPLDPQTSAQQDAGSHQWDAKQAHETIVLVSATGVTPQYQAYADSITRIMQNMGYTV